MLIACKHQSCAIVEQPIRTMYIEGNQSSHFRPVADSMRIYFLLFRFGLLSLLTAALDNLVFIGAFALTGSIGRSQIAGRAVAMVFNYLGAHRAVFHSKQRHAAVLPKYVAGGDRQRTRVIRADPSGCTSASEFAGDGRQAGRRRSAVPDEFRHPARLGLHEAAARSPTATNWDEYYTSVPPTAKLTRRYTTAVLLDMLRRHARRPKSGGRSRIVEIGGANSCFMEEILRNIPCRSYDVDRHQRYGLSLLEKRSARASRCGSIAKASSTSAGGRRRTSCSASGWWSTSTRRMTREAILAHFRCCARAERRSSPSPPRRLLYRVDARSHRGARQVEVPRRAAADAGGGARGDFGARAASSTEDRCGR